MSTVICSLTNIDDCIFCFNCSDCWLSINLRVYNLPSSSLSSNFTWLYNFVFTLFKRINFFDFIFERYFFYVFYFSYKVFATYFDNSIFWFYFIYFSIYNLRVLYCVGSFLASRLTLKLNIPYFFVSPFAFL